MTERCCCCRDREDRVNDGRLLLLYGRREDRVNDGKL